MRDVIICSTPNQVGVQREIFDRFIFEESELPQILQRLIKTEFNFNVQFSQKRILVEVRKTVYSKEIKRGI